MTPYLGSILGFVDSLILLNSVYTSFLKQIVSSVVLTMSCTITMFSSNNV